ncbi:MAG: ADP-ribose pyrophosphatase [Candidatus Nitrosocaldaceae archaeon]|nr:MAG: ADP-ribose pyrophosphatase [Candidatus Nitrosocaldaceae archaeon]
MLERKEVYKGKILSLRVDKVNINGRDSIREVVEHHGSVGILPILDDSFVLEKQYRYAIDKVLLEIPAGTLEDGEEPEECAKRELLEETGYYPNTLTYIGKMYLTPGYCTEAMHFFIADDLELKSKDLDFDEVISTEIIKIEDAIDMATKGEIEDIKTAYAILRYAAKVK